MAAKGGAKGSEKQLLHLVFGGELTTLDRIEFADLKALAYGRHLSPITRKPMTPGKTPPTAPSTTPICAISSCICTACSTPDWRAAGARPRSAKRKSFSP